MKRPKSSPEKRLAEALRQAATIKAYVEAMAERGVTVTQVEWGPADPHKRNSKTMQVIKVGP
jgi:hypothetical protein